MQKEDRYRNFFLGTLIVIGIASLFVMGPFLTSVIGGAILAFVFTPFYRWLSHKINSQGIAAFITVVLIMILIAVPAVILVNNLSREAQETYLFLKQDLFNGGLIQGHCLEDSIVCDLVNKVNALMHEPDTREYILGLLNTIVRSVSQRVSSWLVALPNLAINALILLFTTYYLLIDGKNLVHRMALLIPLRPHHQHQIITQFSEVTYALIYGSFIVALAQGALGAFGFWLFGVQGFLWWGVLMAILALVPFLGTAIVWLPASFFLALNGYLQGESSLVARGIGLFIYGLIVISTADNILKPFIIAGRTQVHPLLVLVGMFGGLYLFGFIGLIIGPFILSLFQTLFEIYEREHAHPSNIK